MVYARERATYSQTRRPRKRYWLDTCKTYSIVQPILERMGQTGFSDLRITNFELTRTPLLFKACGEPGCNIGPTPSPPQRTAMAFHMVPDGYHPAHGQADTMAHAGQHNMTFVTTVFSQGTSLLSQSVSTCSVGILRTQTSQSKITVASPYCASL